MPDYYVNPSSEGELEPAPLPWRKPGLLRRLLALVRAFLLDLYGDPDDWQAAVDAAAEGIAGGDDGKNDGKINT